MPESSQRRTMSRSGRRKRMIRIGTLAITALLAASLAGMATANGRTSATLTIRHQMRGCHTWGIAGGRFSARQSLNLAPGATLRVINNDIMPHTLVQTGGRHVRIVHPRMARMGATSSVRFPRAGVYKFKTRPGEDYPGIKLETKGEDFKLRLSVTVS
jgi:plastocyanin